MPCWRAVPRWPVKPSRAAALGTLLLSLACLPALAQSPGATRYPQRALRLIVPFPPGGSTDILARAVAQSMAESLGQAVVIDNKPGAGGSIGVEAAVHAAPDGYTLVMGHIGTLAVNPAIYSHLPYDPERDLAPIALVALVPNVLVVHPSIEACRSWLRWRDASQGRSPIARAAPAVPPTSQWSISNWSPVPTLSMCPTRAPVRR